MLQEAQGVYKYIYIYVYLPSPLSVTQMPVALVINFTFPSQAVLLLFGLRFTSAGLSSRFIYIYLYITSACRSCST
jgi:hypothetical protein